MKYYNAPANILFICEFTHLYEVDGGNCSGCGGDVSSFGKKGESQGLTGCKMPG